MSKGTVLGSDILHQLKIEQVLIDGFALFKRSALEFDIYIFFKMRKNTHHLKRYLLSLYGGRCKLTRSFCSLSKPESPTSDETVQEKQALEKLNVFNEGIAPESDEHLNYNDFLLNRHIGPNDRETSQMVKICNVTNVDQLVQKAIPQNIVDPDCLRDGAINKAISQAQFLQNFSKMMRENKKYKSYIGLGFYPCITPLVIQRNLLESPGWYTAYTPYQSQISQGRLQALINYQMMVQELTGLEISNASLLDEASAGGEALTMSCSINQGKLHQFFVDEKIFSPTLAVIYTRAKYLNISIEVGKWEDFLNGSYDVTKFCGILVQSPNSDGILNDFTEFFRKINEINPKVVKVVGADLMALSITKPPGEMGADICYGSSQRLGIPMGFGGPHAGFFATKKDYVRKMPGKIIGISKDKDDYLAFRMALQTREQHIRREKATSNICTAQVLLANLSAMYAIYHGPKGLREISFRINRIAQKCERIFKYYGFQTLTQGMTNCQYFDTITIINCDAIKLRDAFLELQINIRVNNESSVSLSFSEVTKNDDIVEIIDVLAKFKNMVKKPHHFFEYTEKHFENNLQRELNFMRQQIFNEIHSESKMLRYLRFLEEKDISLNRSMIPLGSCTMKLNSTSEMIPLTWPELNIHPFAPTNQTLGYQMMINCLTNWLKSITKLDGVSFQPKSGATGQYAGLLTIQKYMESIGERNRNLCLIPKSAHGTNPASAHLAGMKVIPIEVEHGKIDMTDFKKKVEVNKKDLGALMITFPSTAGRYDESIQEMAQIVHHYGGQVYMDGANMNAQVGYTSPGYLGADICHLNLHKTFAIPHGGGGPGMGPIAAKKHLIPFLPPDPFSPYPSSTLIGSTGTSEFGSASILSISFAYIAMLGRSGIRKSTAFAILNANYLMNRLRPYYKILYLENPGDCCSHEFIIDLNEIKKKKGVTEEDVAKRLIDFGFHSPTMSFPVIGTLMIEPTESQDKAELDRFAEAMIKISEQINNKPEILKHAPYTAAAIASQNWQHSFTREEAAYPLPWVKKRGKYWPPVSRIQNPYGDKHLVCSCPDISEYIE